MRIGYISEMGDTSNEYALKYGLDKRENSHMYKDAFRHTFTSAYTTLMYGETTSYVLGGVGSFRNSNSNSKR